MPRLRRILICTALAAAILLVVPTIVPAAPAGTAGQTPAVAIPPVRLKDWQASSQGEKYAFLIGFLSMVELECAWQGKTPLPVERSTADAWVRGLSDVTLRDMANTVERYIAENPRDMDMSVVEVLGKAYVRPKLTKEERAKAGDRYAAMQKELDK